MIFSEVYKHISKTMTFVNIEHMIFTEVYKHISKHMTFVKIEHPRNVKSNSGRDLRWI